MTTGRTGGARRPSRRSKSAKLAPPAPEHDVRSLRAGAATEDWADELAEMRAKAKAAEEAAQKHAS